MNKLLLFTILAVTASVSSASKSQSAASVPPNERVYQPSAIDTTAPNHERLIITPGIVVTPDKVPNKVAYAVSKQQGQPKPTKNIPKIKKTTTAKPNEHAELMTAPTAIANVLADLCPHGMLPIAFGMAAGTGPATASIILAVFGFLSWYSLVSFARAADVVLVNNKSTAKSSQHENNEALSAVWERIVPGGKATSWIPNLGCVCLTVGCLLFYSAFIGDLFGALANSLDILPKQLNNRSAVLLILHAIPILPLCLKRDLSALKYSSATGLVGIIYTVGFVVKRMLDRSYQVGGRFFDSMPAKFRPAPLAAFPRVVDADGTVAGVSPIFGYLHNVPPFFYGKKGLLTLMNMCCVAYACHYNAVKYYMELKTRTVPNLKKVMGYGIGGTGVVFWIIMMIGVATFGGSAQALILNNYHATDDIAATLARAFTGIAIISGYALMFAGLKAALFPLLGLDKSTVKDKESKQNFVTVLLVAAIAGAACFVTEHELATVIGVVGSVFGSVVIYMFPAIINNNLLAMKGPSGKALAAPFFKYEYGFNVLMMLFGVVFAVLGTWMSLEGSV